MTDEKKIIFSMMGVSKTIPPQRKIIKDIYLSFFYGAKIGVIGLNGSGKSTLLKIIAGLDPNYEGKVIWSKEHSIGYLPQEPQDRERGRAGGCSGGDGFVEGVRGGEHEVCRTDE